MRTQRGASQRALGQTWPRPAGGALAGGTTDPDGGQGARKRELARKKWDRHLEKIIKKSRTTRADEHAQKREPRVPLAGRAAGEASVGNGTRLPQTIKSKAASRPSESTAGYVSEEIQNTNLKKMYASSWSLQHCSQ